MAARQKFVPSSGAVPVFDNIMQDLVHLTKNSRVRKSPFWDGVVASGVRGATVYNHTVLPSVFLSLEEDYHHLKNHVQLWDVACQRALEIKGNDAANLVQMMTPRALDRLKIGQCLYVPAVDRNGRILNDPVLLKLEETRYWLSVADSDLLLYALGLAAGFNLDVEIREPDVSPLAVQGPKSEQLMERVFGSEIKRLKFFGFDRFSFDNTGFIISRSGYSKQGGFEIYVDGSLHGMPLWNALMDAGDGLDVRAGCPNYIERVESGLLSYGGDIWREHSPFECGLENYLDVEAAVGCLGREALLQEMKQGLGRQIRCIQIDGAPILPCESQWELTVDGKFAGYISSAVWSPDFEINVAIGMVESPYWDAGTRIAVHTPAEVRQASVKLGFPN